MSHGRRTIDTVREFADDGMDAVAEAASVDAAELADTDGIVAIPGVLELLRSLPKDRWAVVTSAGLDLAARRMAAAGLPFPEQWVTAEDVMRGKPDPSGYILGAERLGTRPQNCLVFEDAPAGIQAGQNAGADVIAIGHAQPHPFEPDCPLVGDYLAVRFALS